MRYRAKARNGSRRVHLGYFDTKEEAAAAVERFRAEHPEGAFHRFAKGNMLGNKTRTPDVVGPPALCECGCGQETRRVRQTDRAFGREKGRPLRFVNGHNGRKVEGRKPRRRKDGYVLLWMPEHANAHRSGWILEHVAVAAAALGRPLPPGTHVHHVNGERADNRPINLVICPDNGYHALLHQRLRALRACGNPGWVLCHYCKRYDAPEAMHVRPRGPGEAWAHRECRNEYERERRAKHRVAGHLGPRCEQMAERIARELPAEVTCR